ACRWGVGANLPGRFGRVMSAPAAALRPPFGRTGSPSRPRHRCNRSKSAGENRFGRRQKKADGQRKHRRGGGGK
ncbi:hypothetical protein QUW15_13965, partial [Desulfovibrio piger]|nr:hypothetical protein [Desulfovibrio piger]